MGGLLIILREIQSNSTKISNKTKQALYLFNIVLEVHQKEIKDIQIGKEEVKLKFADDMIVYVTDPKNSTREHLELINTFSNIAGNKSILNKLLLLITKESK